MAALKAGMPWRRFSGLLSGLSSQSWWFLWLRNRPKAPLEGAAAEAYFSGIGGR